MTEPSEDLAHRRTNELAAANARLRCEIAQRKGTEEATRRRENRYHILFDDSPLSLWEEDWSRVKDYFDALRELGIHDVRRYFEEHPQAVRDCVDRIEVRDVNKAALLLLEARSKDDLSRGIAQFFTAEAFETFRGALIALAGGSRCFECETTCRTLTRKTLPVAVYIRVTPGSESSLDCILVSLLDLSDRKRAEEARRHSEERFRKFFEQGLVGMAITSPEKVCLEVNDCLCEMLGYTRDELLGKTWDALTYPEDLGGNVELFRRAMAGEIDGYQIEKRFRRKDGRIVFASLSTKCVRTTEGSPDYFLTLIRDVTERKSAEERLLKEQRLLRQSLEIYERDRQWMATEIHDAVAQPLTAALMNLDGLLPLVRSGRTDLMEENFARATELLRDCIGQSRRIMSELRPPVLDEFGIVAAIEYLVCECEMRSSATVTYSHDVHFERLSPPLETAVFRIVQECLHNTQRHSASDRVEVRLRQQADRLEIQVEDWGIGFEPERVAQDRFGLEGLRERAEFFGGEAAIDSAPGRGTRILVTLPVVERPPDGA